MKENFINNLNKKQMRAMLKDLVGKDYGKKPIKELQDKLKEFSYSQLRSALNETTT